MCASGSGAPLPCQVTGVELHRAVPVPSCHLCRCAGTALVAEIPALLPFPSLFFSQYSDLWHLGRVTNILFASRALYLLTGMLKWEVMGSVRELAGTAHPWVQCTLTAYKIWLWLQKVLLWVDVGSQQTYIAEKLAFSYVLSEAYFFRALFCVLLWTAVKLSVLLIGMAGALPVAELCVRHGWAGAHMLQCSLLLELKTCWTHPDYFHIFHVSWSQALSFILLCEAAQWSEFMLDTAYIRAV